MLTHLLDTQGTFYCFNDKTNVIPLDKLHTF
jgi:hypothetical protein